MIIVSSSPGEVGDSWWNMTDASGLLYDVVPSVLASSLSDLVGFLPGEVGDGLQREGPADLAMTVSTTDEYVHVQRIMSCELCTTQA